MPHIPVVERRRRLVAAALEVIAADGMAAASVRAITAQAGMPLAAFHYAFRDKSELFEVLIAELPEAQLQAALSSLSLGVDLADTLRLGFQAPFLAWLEAPEHHIALLELTLHAVRTDELAELARRQYERYFANVEQFLAAVAAEHGVEFVPTPAIVAQLATGILDGITLSWLATRDDEAALTALAAAGDAVVALTRPHPATGSGKTTRSPARPAARSGARLPGRARR